MGKRRINPSYCIALWRCRGATLSDG